MPSAAKKSKVKSSLEAAFLLGWRALAPEMPVPVEEFLPIKGRRFRADFAWVQEKVAVELEGIGGGKSRHTSLTGYTKDCEKYNMMQMDGWIIYRITSLDMEALPVHVERISTLIQQRQHRQHQTGGHIMSVFISPTVPTLQARLLALNDVRAAFYNQVAAFDAALLGTGDAQVALSAMIAAAQEALKAAEGK